MCLIIYAPAAQLTPRKRFTAAAEDNPDGIGVMSADGVEKFLGKRKTRRAYNYIKALARAGIPYAVHFRWATHGKVARSNTHPFEIPGTGAYLMHNGILWTSQMATDDISDTRIYAEQFAAAHLNGTLPYVDDAAYLDGIGGDTKGNRLLIMRDDGARFDIVNRHLWTLSEGIWYSNTLSFGWKQSGGYGSWLQGSPSSGSRNIALAAIRSQYQRNEYSRTDYASPSGPTLGYEDDGKDLDDDSEEYAWLCWDDEYQSFMDAGYNAVEAERKADDYLREKWGITVFRDTKKSGFDWHDSSTWEKYPIPGTVDAALNRHGSAEGPGPDDDDDGTIRPSDMFV